MSSKLTCNDPFGYNSGLEDGNSSGPSPVSNSNLGVWKSSLGQIIKVSKAITIDSVFASFSLNQQGGNYSSSGYLYEIWLDGFVNNGVNGNLLNSNHWLFFVNLLTLDVHDLVVVETQDVDDPTYGNITKVLVADPIYSEKFSKYVNEIQLGSQVYSISTTPLAEYANKGVFDLNNDIQRKVNFSSKNPPLLIDAPLLSYTTPTSLWIESPESVLTYPQLKPGNSLRLQRRDNSNAGFEVIINGTPSYRSQINDVTTSSILNLSDLKIGKKIALDLNSPYQVSYNKGDVVYVSNQIIDIKSGNFGLDYVKAIVLSFDSGTLELMVTFKPNNALAAGSNWYIISEVNQINIPISSNYYLSLLGSTDILDYNLLNCIMTVRLQVQDNKKFNRYVFRYKPDNSSTWKYVETILTNTIIENVLPNTVFQEEIMGFNDSTGDYCGFSESGTFNTFF